MRPVSPLLEQYKTLSKITTRDVSLRSKYQGEITKVLRDIERWVSEVRVAANVAGGAFGWDTETVNEQDENGQLDTKERVALEGLCDALLEKGCLVPLSKRSDHHSAFSID
jgi:ribosomal biogenesis protein LAS1